MLKVLANQAKEGRMSGEVLFNGEPANEKTHHRDVAFVAQEDIHFRMFLLQDCNHRLTEI